ncbi:MAG: hypothetical protein J5764_05295, partial [Bacteroidales bacterium]|nr:hypothetical protein [Bacteroidales bacterium]
MIRKFCFYLLMLAAVAACGGEKPDPGPVEPEIPEHYTVSGTVTSDDGAALAGVTVSDGYVCAKTGQDGKYYLDSDLSDRDYVFVSTPSSCSAPLVDGTPVFWKFFKDCTRESDGKYSGVDFTLNRIANPGTFSIFIYADPQPRARTAGYDNIAYHALDCCNDMYRDMKELRATITDRPVYGIGLGDIVHRDLTLLTQFKRGMADAGVANYAVIGNHDHDVDKSD